MEHDNHIPSDHTSSVAQTWAYCFLASALLLFLADAILLFHNVDDRFLSIVYLSAFLALAIVITGIVSFATAFKKTVPSRIRVVAIVALVLSLLSLTSYFFVYVFYTSCLHGC